jgi:hypothetical protein
MIDSASKECGSVYSVQVTLKNTSKAEQKDQVRTSGLGKQKERRKGKERERESYKEG